MFSSLLPLLLSCISVQAQSTTAPLPSPTTLWKGPLLNSSDTLYAGLKQIEGVKHNRVYDGSQVGRTYSHHAIVENLGGRLFTAWSTAANDEDSMGQNVWVSTAVKDSTTLTWKWGTPVVATGALLLPNQTSIGERNYTYWCNAGITQRALQPNTIVQHKNSVYIIIEAADRYCVGGKGGTRSPGRLAVQFSRTGARLSKACWLVQNPWTTADLYAKTAVGAHLCSPALISGLEPILLRPELLPFSNSLLINSPAFKGSDGTSNMIEVTRAVWNASGGYWRRFWRDSSSKTTYVTWVEYSRDSAGKDWYPIEFNNNGSNNIFATNIPDSNTKAFYGALPDGRTYLVSNLQYHPDTRERQPLCISVASNGVHFDWAAVLHTNASRVIIPDSRAIKRVGFSYPHATVVGNSLFVAYSEDKEDIIVTEVPIASLGK